jgi:hypothetical protein
MVKIPFSYRVRESRRELTRYPGPDFLALIEFATIQRGLLLQPSRGRDAHYEYVDHANPGLGEVLQLNHLKRDFYPIKYYYSQLV